MNHGLEVNVEADLDPAVDLMNTDGPIDVACAIGRERAFDSATVARNGGLAQDRPGAGRLSG